MKRAAEILESKKEEILTTWLEKVKEEILATQGTNDLVLRDHLPDLLQDIIKIMRRYENFDVIREEEVYEEIFENSREHGRHRATTSGYTLEQMLKEYVAFHRILTDELLTEEAYNTEVGVVIKYSIENAMLYSGSAFSESLQEMRQKLIGVLAHDMRNPISAAYMAVGMMSYDDGRERFEKIRKMAHNSLKRSVVLVEDLLDSITLEAGEGITLHFSEVNIMENVTSVYEEASEIYSTEIQLKTDRNVITGIFDATMVRRVLENFLSNAIKYGDREQPITIQIRDEEEEVVIGVHNFGNPIPKERQQAIFDFLNTSGKGPRSLKSWGMGLTLVRAVAKAHGGDLQLESDEEKGTTFSICLKKSANKAGKIKAALGSVS